jgi:uncharacterized protein YjdB
VFYGCVGLESVVVSKGLDNIPTNAFCFCKSLTEVVIPDGVTSLGQRAFGYCYSLEKIDLPDSITSIEGYAFDSCYSLSDISLPLNLESIGDRAFFYTGVTKVQISTKLSTIGEGVFLSCDSLESIEVAEDNPYFCSKDGVLFDKDMKILYVCPQTIGDYSIPVSVETISEFAFNCFKNVISFDDATNLKTIEECAFRYCDGLVNVVIPDNVEVIGSSAFYYCSNLVSISIPNSVTEIGSGVFKGCSKLSSITVADGNGSYCSKDGVLFDIDKKTLVCCPAKAITGIYEIPTTVTEIASAAFYSCSNITEVVIPESVSVIGEGAFERAYKLSKINIPQGVTAIYQYTFYECNALKEIDLPDSIIGIGNYAFADCENLENFVLPSALEHIGFGAFNKCTSLESVVVPDNVAKIGTDAFKNCSKLASVYIPSTTTSIGNNAFQNCSSDLTIYAVEDSYAAQYAADNGITVDYVEETEDTSDFTYKELSDGTIEITGYTGTDLDVTIPGTINQKTVSSIGINAFEDKSVTSVIIPEGVTTINQQAFYNCQKLKSITIPEGVTSIGSTAFYWCQALTEIKLPSSLTTIGAYAFWGCYNLTSVSIPGSVSSIGTLALYCGYDMKEINVDSSNTVYTSVGGVLFSKDMTTLITCPPKAISSSYSIPKGVTSIQDGAFRYCTDLKTLTIPSGVEKIGTMAFEGCTALTSVTFPSTVTSIGKNAFQDCASKVTFSVYKDSYAEQYAEDNSITYVYIEEKEGDNQEGDNQETENTDFTYKTLTDGTLQITGYSGAGSTMTIPDTIGGNVVSSIDFDSSLDRMNNIEKMVIPKHVNDIATMTFYHFGNLAEIEVDEENETYCSVDGVVFSKDGSKLIRCPLAMSGEYEVNSGVTVIGKYAFYCCQNLTNILLPKGLLTIENGAFMNCIQLSTITIPFSVETISTSIFTPFAECSSLKEILVQEGNAYYTSENGVLFDKKKTTLLCCPGSITTYEIPKMVKKIGAYSFYDNSIRAVTIPSGVTEIGQLAFISCKSLTTVNIPKTVTKIGSQGFDGCPLLSFTVVKDSYAESYAKSNSIPYSYVDEVSEYSYEIQTDGTIVITGYNGTDTVINIPEKIDGYTVSGIGDGAFENCSQIKTLTLPDSIVKIGDNAFRNCDGLTEVIIPNKTVQIGSGAFVDCDSLKYITIPESVTDIATDSFFDEDDDDRIKLALKVIKGSYAEKYADQLGIEMVILVNSITLNETSLELKIGEQSTLVATILPTDATNQTVIWSSGNTNVASVVNGLVTAKAVGTTLITAKDATGKVYSTCSVTVLESGTSSEDTSSEEQKTTEMLSPEQSEIPVSKIVLDAETVEIVLNREESKTITATVQPANATNQTLKWSSSDTSVATVNQSGNVTPKKIGTAVITAIDSTGTVKSNCTVNVVGSRTEIVTETKYVYITINPIKVADVLTMGNEKYKVTSLDKKTLSCVGISDSNNTEVIIPSEVDINGEIYKVTAIGKKAFQNNKKLNKITIGANVTKIGENAFYGCKSLSSITMNTKKLTLIGYKAFKGIAKGATVYTIGNKKSVYTKLVSSSSKGTSAIVSNGMYQVLNGKKKQASYIGTASATATKIKIPAKVKIAGKKYSVTKIAKGALKNNKKVKKITVGTNVKTIEKDAFTGCKNLRWLKIQSKKITKIGKSKLGSGVGIQGTVPAGMKTYYSKLLKNIKK